MKDSEKIILDLCGGTGRWGDPYRRAGYDVRLVTLPDNDVRLYIPPKNVYGVLAAPPCEEFSIAKHFHGKGNYSHDFIKGLEVLSACCRVILTCDPVFWAIENPANGLMKRWMLEPAMTFSPWQYGDKYQKSTAIWGKFNIPVQGVTERPDGMKKFSALRSKEIFPEYYGVYSRQVRRAITPPGFAQAFFRANR